MLASTGLSPSTAHRLVTAYTRPRDLIVDFGTGPTLGRVAVWLDRRATTNLTDCHCDLRTQPDSASAPGSRDGAGLIVARVPRERRGDPDLHRLTDAVRWWRGTLRPGGFLVVIAAAQRSGDRFADHATTIVTAARAAGLRYHQHLIDVLAPLPEHDPPAAVLPPGDRHATWHRDLFVFAAPKEARDA